MPCKRGQSSQVQAIRYKLVAQLIIRLAWPEISRAAKFDGSNVLATARPFSLSGSLYTAKGPDRCRLTFSGAWSRNRTSLNSRTAARVKDQVKIERQLSRREFLGAASSAAVTSSARSLAQLSPLGAAFSDQTAADKPASRIVDMHVHFDEKKPGFLDDLLKLSDRINLTACLLTPFAHRKVVADAAKQHPRQIVPFGFIDLDAPDVARQVEELHSLGFRGLGELEFVKKPYNDPSYFPVYELANRYGWLVLFHTGIVLRKNFDQPEDVASGRMRPIYLEEIARRFPKITVVGAHCGNPEYEWAAEIARWNPNVFFDLSGSTLTKMRGRLADFQRIFWWSSLDWSIKTPGNDPSAFVKLVFGSDTDLSSIESVVTQYRALFEACDVPERTRKMIMGGTLIKLLDLPE